jgi:hypothetical protein
MGKSISLFTGYSKNENRTTNYCLLILKMLYDESPKLLSEVIATLTNETIGNMVGVKFSQQEKKINSIPDGLVTQRSFSIYIETKNFDWFYDAQLENHLESLSKENSELKILFAIGNFESDTETRFQKIKTICETKYTNSIYFRAISFEEFVNAIPKEINKNLSDAVSDFKDYLYEQDLLPTWGNYLDVVNCAGWPDDVLNHNVYMCPAAGGAYNHYRCKYFGMYRDKKVEKVALIKAVVDVNTDWTALKKWKHVNDSDDDLIQQAIDKVKLLRPTELPIRIFLLGDLYDTEFIKDSSGGMQGSKQYFDISKLQVKNEKELAEKLKGKTWSSF